MSDIENSPQKKGKIKRIAMATAALGAAAAVTYGMEFGFTYNAIETIGAGAVKSERTIKGNDNSNNVRKNITTGDIKGETVIFQ